VKASEYGGSDTHKTQGVQPAPHPPSAAEQLRLTYGTDPVDATSGPDETQPRRENNGR
jgi:hypothetical protein